MRLKFITLDKKLLLEKCRSGDPRAQRLLYEQYAGYMLGLCRRYLTNIQEAEDALMKGFVKAFKELHRLQDDERFEYWMRRIMTNECLMILRKKKNMQVVELNQLNAPALRENAIDKLSEKDILQMIDKLPIGYRTVFNMYVIDGYKHREIAEQLNISVNTSKSQLIMARKRLQEMIDRSNAQLNAI